VLEKHHELLLATDSFRWTETKWIVDLANGKAANRQPEKRPTFATVALTGFLALQVEADILKSVAALHEVHNRASTYMVMFLLILAMCVCSICVPARFIGEMVTLTGYG